MKYLPSHHEYQCWDPTESLMVSVCGQRKQNGIDIFQKNRKHLPTDFCCFVFSVSLIFLLITMVKEKEGLDLNLVDLY